MGDVGLLLIGAVLMVNGLGLLGRFPSRSAVPLNFLVAGVQLVLPTLGLVLDHGDPTAPARYAAIYLFGATYLWVGIDSVRGPQGGGDGIAFGWFSGFVTVIAVIEGFLSLRSDPAFAISWWLWAFMWAGFLGTQALNVRTVFGAPLAHALGWLMILGGQLSATLPSLLRLNHAWPSSGTFTALMSVAGVLVLALSWALGKAGLGVPRLADPTSARA